MIYEGYVYMIKWLDWKKKKHEVTVCTFGGILLSRISY